MSEDIGELIGGVIGVVFLLYVMLNVIPPLADQIGEHDHPEYESTIESQEQTISELRDRIDTLEAQRDNLSARYERLVRENVTKKDVDDIEKELNRTATEIRIMNQRFETINQDFISSYQKTVTQYQLMFGLSLFSISFIFLDIISGAFLGRSYTNWISTRLQNAAEKVQAYREADEE